MAFGAPQSPVQLREKSHHQRSASVALNCVWPARALLDLGKAQIFQDYLRRPARVPRCPSPSIAANGAGPTAYFAPNPNL